MSKVQKVVLIGIFSGLAGILALIEIPYFIPWLKFDISEIVILYSVTLLGLPAAIAVSFIKTMFQFLNGSTGPFFIGEITALVASLTIAITFYLSKHLPLVFRMIVTVLVFTIVMTALNFFFVTPIYLGANFYTDLIGNTFEYLPSGVTNSTRAYLIYIISVYVPFNLVKGSIIAILYVLTQKTITNMFAKIYNK